jgi:hypothetical protein
MKNVKVWAKDFEDEDEAFEIIEPTITEVQDAIEQDAELRWRDEIFDSTTYCYREDGNSAWTEVEVVVQLNPTFFADME